MKNSFGKHKWKGFLKGKGFYGALGLCLAGAVATAWVAADRTLNGVEEQNRLLFEQAESQQSTEEEVVWETPPAAVQHNVEEEPKPSSSSSQPSDSSALQQPSAAPAVPSAQPAASPVRSKSDFVLPVPGAVFRRFSGEKLVKDETMGDWRTHSGVDFAAEPNQDVTAVQTGTVTKVENHPLWGWVVELDHGGGLTSRTCGLRDKVAVAEGERVSAGQVIGRVGTVPAESALKSHIHLEILQDGVPVEPLEAMGKM